VQMSTVAAAAGLSTGALYLHFPSKPKLLCEVYRVQAGAELQVVADIAAREAPAATRLAEAISAFAQRAMSNRRLAYAMVLEPTENDVEEERLRFHAAFIEQFRRIVDDGVASGEFAVADSRVAAACVFGGITESLMGPLAVVAPSTRGARKRADADALVAQVVAFCAHGLGQRAARRR
jgi:AcrR family transcriptional regulator